MPVAVKKHWEPRSTNGYTGHGAPMQPLAAHHPQFLPVSTAASGCGVPPFTFGGEFNPADYNQPPNDVALSQKELPYLPSMKSVVAQERPSKRRKKNYQHDAPPDLTTETVLCHPHHYPPCIGNVPPAPISQPLTDKEGHFVVTDGCYVTPRCISSTLFSSAALVVTVFSIPDQVVQVLGQGTFGKVLQVYDRNSDEYVAIKIIRALPKYTEASMIEIKVLQLLEKNDRTGLHHCIKLERAFTYHGHTCMVFPLLSKSVYDYMKWNSFEPITPRQAAEITFQLIDAVEYLHSIGIIHTDLKPENVMIVDSASRNVSTSRRSRRIELYSTEIVLIDFGSAVREHDFHGLVVSTRHYRAPEIILGAGWSYPWDPLFQTHDKYVAALFCSIDSYV
ncbi:dual specificity protein kinase kns1 [Thoreauomyces humboldtii]|nr:dual specificity protein kinase kns1 [Thoreauomyces humboldtii]